MLKKKFLKTKCKVEFSLPTYATDDMQEVCLVGEFTDWDTNAIPMEKKGANFKTTVDLALDQEYQFRYLVNDVEWHNDWEADAYVANPFSGDNSVVNTFLPNGTG